MLRAQPRNVPASRSAWWCAGALVLVSACASFGRPGAASSAPTTPAHDETDSSAAAGTLLPDTPAADRFMVRLGDLLQRPRTLGDPRRRSSIDALERTLVDLGLEAPERIEHVATDPATGEGYALVNLIAHLRPRAPRRFVLATHFDTRPWSDEEPDEADRHHPVPGANDGTSGLAVILELVPVLARTLPADVGMTVVLFDGEELGRPGHGGYCKGSRYVARSLRAGEPSVLGTAELGIVLDMVGDADLRILMEPTSLETHPTLVEHVWQAAADAGHDAFVSQVGPTPILDDHTFLSEAGIPSILLIDYDYPAWHTRGDTEQRVSGTSMQVVADVVLRSLLAWYAPAGS
jgi:glutaminyl-peptide cyclotransferase